MCDVRELQPKDRHPRILGSFDSLARGSSFVLVTDHNPRPLLTLMQSERAGQFDWSPLEEGPELWRVSITRRSGDDAGERGVAEYLEWDHDRLDGLLERASSLVTSGNRAEAAALFSEFKTGLLRHIRMEEEVLFPAFEQATDFGRGGPTTVMRSEHLEIRGVLQGIEEFFKDKDRDPGEFARLRHSLLAVLGEHNSKEEHVVYPMTDQALPPGQRDELVRRMQAV